MQLLATALRRLVAKTASRRPPAEWWSYFGAFGDDFFSDDFDAAFSGEPDDAVFSLR